MAVRRLPGLRSSKSTIVLASKLSVKYALDRLCVNGAEYFPIYTAACGNKSQSYEGNERPAMTCSATLPSSCIVMSDR